MHHCIVYLEEVFLKSLSILGATGSIGESALKIVRQHTDRFQIHTLTGYRNAPLLAQLAHEFKPKIIAIADGTEYANLKDLTQGLSTTILGGQEGIIEAAKAPVDVVLSAISGIAALEPTFTAMAHCQVLALANKEAIVAAGPLMLAQAHKHKTSIVPVDSEHNAIFQVFEETQRSAIEKIILTASGGPFRDLPLEQFANITPSQALKHPNWVMGSKITIDSATLMNKALELIEAHHLFQMPEDKIDVVVHPQSIIHSLVAYKDGSVLAQLGTPDMCTPISYALGWPQRLVNDVRRLNLLENPSLTFVPVDNQKFPGLELARHCLRWSPSASVVFNSTNEYAVAAFLAGKISFLDIYRLINQELEAHQPIPLATIDDVIALHKHIQDKLSSC